MRRSRLSLRLLAQLTVTACLGMNCAAAGADEQTDRLKLAALTQEGDLILDEANALQPVTERLAREGEQLDQVEPKLREESSVLDAAIAKFNGQNTDLERAVQEHRSRCPRETEDKALLESCNAMATGLQSVAQQLEQERPQLQTRQQELKGRIDQHNGARRDWAARKRDHDARLLANKTDAEPWLVAAKAFLATESVKAMVQKAGNPQQCKAGVPAESEAPPPVEGVRRVQACLKALAAASAPAAR